MMALSVTAKKKMGGIITWEVANRVRGQDNRGVQVGQHLRL